MSEGCFQDGGNGSYWLESVQRGKIISQLSIVASQELVGCCKHINIEGLAFRPFPVNELKHRFILGSTLQVSSIALLTKAVTPLQQVYNRHRR